MRFPFTLAPTIQLKLAVIVMIVLSSCSKVQKHDLVITNANIIDVKTGKVLKDRTVAVDRNRISVIYEDEAKFDETTQVLDAQGKFIIPGLCDSHMHIGFLTTTEGDTLINELADFVRRGVLYFRDVGDPVDVMSKLKTQISSGELDGPEIYYTGPMLESGPLYWEGKNEFLPGFTVPLDNRKNVDSLLPLLAEEGATLIKTFNNINPELYPYIVEIANQNKLKIVHDPGIRPIINRMPIGKALELGVTSFEHAIAPWNYILKDEYRADLETINSQKTDLQKQAAFMVKIVQLGTESISEQRLETLCQLMKERNAVLCPTLLVFRSLLDAIQEAEANQPGNEELAKSLALIKSLNETTDFIVRELSAHGVKLLVGQDDFKPEGTVKEMVLLSEAGVDNIEILRAATIYAAEWLEISDKYGSIEEGKMADMVLLNADPLADISNVKDVFHVIQHGKLVK